MDAKTFANKMELASKRFVDVERVGVQKAAKAVKLSVDASIGEATHGTFILRGTAHRKRPAPIHAITQDQPGTKPAVMVTVPGRDRGVVGWLERGTRKHVVGAGRGRGAIGQTAKGRVFTTNKNGRRSYKRKLLATPYGPKMGPFLAGGSPAKHTFSKGVAAVRDEIPRIVQRESVKAMTQVLK